MSVKKRHTVGRILLGLLLLIIIATAGFGIWFSGHYRQILKKEIPIWIAKATDSVYKVSIRDIRINIINRRVTVSGIELQPDSDRIAQLKALHREPSVVFSASIPQIRVWGVSWEAIATEKELNCRIVHIYSPNIRITSAPKLVDSLEQNQTETLLINEQEKKKSSISGVHIGRITVSDQSLDYMHVDTAGKYHCYLVGGSINMRDWEFVPKQPKDGDRFLYSKQTTINIDSIAYVKDGSLYTIRAKQMHFVSDSNLLSLRNFAVRCKVGHDEYYRIKGHQTDLLTFSVGSAQLHNFRWRALLDSSLLAVDTLSLREPVLDDYFSRLVPPSNQSKKGKFPIQLVTRLKQKLAIGYIRIREGHVKYTELNAQTHMSGVITFDEMNGGLSNLTNVPELISRNDHCVLKLSGQLFKRSPISATFTFSLSDPAASFNVDGQLQDVEAAQINATAKALALTEIPSVHISKTDLHISGNETYGRGSVTMLYNDLKVVPQEVGNDKQLNKKHVTSFLANTLLIYPDNPMEGKPVRNESSYVPRDLHKSFFNLIWKCLFNSIQKTAIRSDNMARKLEEKEKHPGQKKKGLLSRIFGRKDKDKK
jgi:hypothetical protein